MLSWSYVSDISVFEILLFSANVYHSLEISLIVVAVTPTADTCLRQTLGKRGQS